MKTDKPSVPGIVDPMLASGKYTRAQIMDEVRRLRPDFKDPSAAVSNGVRRLTQAGNTPTLKDGEARRGRKPGVPRPPSEKSIKDGMRKIDEMAARLEESAKTFSKQIASYREAAAKEPRMRRIWP